FHRFNRTWKGGGGKDLDEWNIRWRIENLSEPSPNRVSFVGKKHDQILFLTLNSQSLPPSSSQSTRHNPQQIPLVECIRRPPTALHFPVLIPITSSPKTEASSVSSTNRIRVCEFLNFGRYSGDRVDVVVKQFLAPSTGCFFFKYIRFRLPEAPRVNPGNVITQGKKR
ncbi:hypothetical protein NC653_007657, partial [Populus alba x Populus x berolinensis]